MIVTFTGTRAGMTEGQRQTVASMLASLGMVHMAVHGGAIGADRQFHALAKGFRRNVWPSSRLQAEWAKAHSGPEDFVEPVILKHLVRNRRMVDMADAVIAAPAMMVEEVRSGTWATVRYARQRFTLGIRSSKLRYIYLCWPDGTMTLEERKDPRRVY